MKQVQKIIKLLIILLTPFCLTAAPLKTSVKVLEVVPSDMSTQLNFTGYLTPTQRTTIRSEMNGTVEKIDIQEGQMVNKGDILVHISTEILALDVEKAQADYELASTNYLTQEKTLQKRINKRKLTIALNSAKTNLEKAQLDFGIEKRITELDLTHNQLLLKKQLAASNYQLAKSEYEKEKQLLQKNMSSQSKLDTYQNKAEAKKISLELADLDLANNTIKSDQYRLKNTQTVLELRKLEYEKAQLELEDYNTKTDRFRLANYKNQMDQAKIRLKQARINFKKSQIKAPFTGIIRQKNVEYGGYVRTGETILELIEISNVYVKTNIPETQIRHLKINQTASITLDAYPDSQFTGIIETIGLEADLKTRSFPVEIKISNPTQTLLPGMMSRISITQNELRNQILIPSYAIIEKEHSKVIYVEDNGKAIERIVKTGQLLEGKVQITAGIRSGEKLIVSGHQFLANNDDILVIETSKQLVSK